MFLLDMRVQSPPSGEDGLTVRTVVDEKVGKMFWLQMPPNTPSAAVSEHVTEPAAVMIILPRGYELVQILVWLNWTLKARDGSDSIF